MDTPERPQSQPERPAYLPPAPLPPPSQAPAPTSAAPAWEEPEAVEVEPVGRPFNPKIIWRAFRRHWWQILLLWAAASATVVTLIYYKIRPTYQAIGILKVEPSARSLITESYSTPQASFGPFLKTQTLLATSPDVLSAALQDPKVQGVSLVRQSLDPELDLRAALQVLIQEGSHLFTVSMETVEPAEGALIVNAVIKAYTKAAEAWSSEEMTNQINRLKDMERQYQADVDKQRNALQKLYSQEGGQDATEQLRDQITKGGPMPVSYEEFRRFAEHHTEVEVKLITASTELSYLRGDLENRRAKMRQAIAARSPEEIKQAVQELFMATPAVAQLMAEIEEQEGQLENLKRPIRNYQNDPAYRLRLKEVQKLRDQYQDYWTQMYPTLRDRVTKVAPEDQELLDAREQELRRAELEVKRLEIEEAQTRKRLEELEIEQREVKDLSFRIEMERTELNNALSMLDIVQKNLTQIEYERRGNATISVVAYARPTGQPATNNRLKLMAAAPVGLLALVLGIFTLVEIRAARVADPDDLPGRVRLGVLGVVPPLPAPGGGRGLRRRDDRRRVEEFVQSLDHLRVALYAARPDGSRRRCVLITSAVGGEGKTTLAAQLAGRCANAGLLTVLVDADLRRPSLGELLEVPEGPGLAEVLANEVDPEAAMVVIGNAGGFHLLPAGAPGRDPSRLLHGERLAELIAQLRATFDVVIVDAPPVLAVPDALLLGRWTDGAVLAVRHDSSRFPLVERANRRLAAVGIPVLGAVVNGCRTMETNYGAYHYNAYSGRGADHGPA
jgi:succinoglycan biosynthesis transport protein ExoP